MKQLLISTALLLCLQVCRAQTAEPVPPASAQEDDKIFTKTDVPPAFTGGNNAWSKYVMQSLGGFNPADNGAPKGKYKVVIRFIVWKNGTVSDVVAETKLGYGLEERSIQLITNSPAWVPAKQNGHVVTAYHRQPVTFVVE